MMAVTEICVTPTDLAAFLEGSLTGEERDRMVRHLNHCLDCFERYIGAARLLDAIEEEEESTLSPADVNIMAQNLSYDYKNHQSRVWGEWRPSARSLEETKTPVEVAEAWVSAQRGFLEALVEALATLSPEDQLILKMREQFSVAEIARTLNLEQKPLYRRLEKIYKSLRSTLKSKGFRTQDIEDIFQKPGARE